MSQHESTKRIQAAAGEETRDPTTKHRAKTPARLTDEHSRIDNPQWNEHKDYRSVANAVQASNRGTRNYNCRYVKNLQIREWRR